MPARSAPSRLLLWRLHAEKPGKAAFIAWRIVLDGPKRNQGK
ncbi:MAG: hypothetical protein WAW96_07335 [Alphaproteobacteria bacterium]